MSGGPHAASGGTSRRGDGRPRWLAQGRVRRRGGAAARRVDGRARIAEEQPPGPAGVPAGAPGAPRPPRRSPHDPLQRHVVAHTDGPLLVVGGPGTGKTTVLVEAVAARVAEGVDPERILVLTFGRRGATALRDRIEARIAGDAGRIVHEPLVRTFHAYAFGLLRRAAAERGEPSPRLLTGPEQDLIIRELLQVVGDDAARRPDRLARRAAPGAAHPGVRPAAA